MATEEKICVHLSSSYSPERVNKLELYLFSRCLINILTALLNHFCDRSFQLAPSFGQANDIFIKKVPLLSFKTNLNNCFQDATS